MAEDYLVRYRRFFEEFLKLDEDPLPLRVASYNLTDDDLLGQIVDCSIQYLYLIDCPFSLQSHLAGLIVDEVYKEYKKSPQPSYEAFKILQHVQKAASEIFRQHLDNETLSKLPPPLKEIKVSALGIRHVRRKMEDKLVYIQGLHTVFNIKTPTNQNPAYYAIFDGHNGVDAANYSVSHLHQFLVESPHYPSDIEKAFREAYLKTDKFVTDKEVRGGTTGLAILLETSRMIVSWLGDSQAMLIKAGKPYPLVNPHRPDRPDEVERIIRAGGYVIEVDGIHRVNGDLGVARAIGDFQFKPMVTAEPDVVSIALDGTEEALIMGCDGFWDVLDPERVCETFLFQVQKEPDKLNALSKCLVNLAKEFDSTDNISVIVVVLKSPSEITRPLPPQATMENPEVEPFRSNGDLLKDIKQEIDDYGPETDVDAPDDTSPFEAQPLWNRPDPLQVFPDLSTLKTQNLRFNNDYSMDNPFSNNLDDIAEEKTDDKQEKDSVLNGVNGNHIESNELCTPMLSQECSQGNPFPDFSAEKSHEVFKNFLENETTELAGEQVLEAENLGFDLSEKSRKVFHDFTGEKIKDLFPNDSDSDLRENLSKESNFMFDNVELVENAGSEVRRDLPDVVNVSESETAKFSDSMEEASHTKLKSPNLNTSDDIFGLIEDNNKGPCSEKENESINPFEAKQKNFENVSSSYRPATELETLPACEVNDPRNPFETTDEISEIVHGLDRATPEGTHLKLETLKSMMEAAENEDASKSMDSVTAEIPLDSCDVPLPPSPWTSDLEEGALKEIDGVLGVEDVGETGVDGEESEDEWNYYKPGQNPTPKSAQEEGEANMNSHLNPDAEEFVPIAPVGQVTPLKAVPNLDEDFQVSSPSWPNMDHVEVPDEEEFLEAIKTKPGDVTLDPEVEPFQPSQSLVSDMIEGIKPLEDEPVQVPLVETSLILSDKVDDVKAPVEPPALVAQVLEQPEVPQESSEATPRRGLDLATDMTSSFIDPSTMGDDSEPQETKAEETKQDIVPDKVEIFEPEVTRETPVVPEESGLVTDEIEPSTPRSTVAEPASTPPSTPQTADLLTSAIPDQIEEVVDKLSAVDVAAATALTTAAVAGAVGAAVKKSTPKASPVKTTPTTKTTTPRSLPAGKTATPSIPDKSKVRTSTTKTTSPRVPLSPATVTEKKVAASKVSTSVAPKTAASGATKNAAPAAKPVKTTIPPRPTAGAAPTKPRLPSAPSNGVTNTDVKPPTKPVVKSTNPLRPASATTRRVAPPVNGVPDARTKTANVVAKKPEKAAEPLKKPTVTNRVPLSSAPKAATVKPPATKTAAPKPAARPTSAGTAVGKPKPATTTATKKTASVTKSSGVMKPESKTEAKPISNGVTKTAE